MVIAKGEAGALLSVGDRVFDARVFHLFGHLSEGCAAILWKMDKSKVAADSLKLTAQDLLQLG